MHAVLASAAIPLRQGTGADLTDLLLALVALIVLVVAVAAAVAVHHGSTPTHRPPATHH